MARNKKVKKEKQTIFIFVEGQTELKYFEILRQSFRLSNVKVKPIILDNSGNDWIDKTKNMLKNNPRLKRNNTSDVYIIFDRDELSINKLNSLFSKAEKESFKIGFSNTSFEVWLLAHFEKVTSGLLSTSSLYTKLTKHLKTEYKKANSTQLEKIIDNLDEAINNSKNISTINFNNQSTNIGSIIEQIQ